MILCGNKRKKWLKQSEKVNNNLYIKGGLDEATKIFLFICKKSYKK